MSIRAWIDRDILSLKRDMRLSYLPPLMVYLAAGVSGLTGIVGTFVVKEYLGLSAQFLAALGFWAGIPWALKMPLGHLVDLMWRYKAAFVYLGATLIALALVIMYMLVAHTEAMRAMMPLDTWYVTAALLAPVGYVLQDVVADAMTVEAVPRIDAAGNPIADAERKLMNTTMQVLGRVAIIGGGLLVSLLNVYILRDMQALSQEAKAVVYGQVYALALVIPIVSIAGVVLQGLLNRREARRLTALGVGQDEVRRVLSGAVELTKPNWWILGASVGFVAFSLAIGLSRISHAEEIVFAGSMAIVLFLMVRITRELDQESRRTLIGTALVIFVFRAIPSPGEGVSWFMIDELKFDQQFFAVLSLISAALTLAGMFIFRRFIAEHSIADVVGALTVAGTVLALPMIGLYYGVHEWTMARTAGTVDARFIAVVNTALQSPLGQIAMIPMLAWIAHSAPSAMKATYFAVMASFTNLALSAAELGTKYLNGVFTVTREVKDRATGIVKVPADYSELGVLLITVTAVGFVVPLAAIILARMARLRSA